MIRDATREDFPAVLQLNAASEHWLSPLDMARLEWLHSQAAYHRVYERDGRVTAFLLAFREGCAYDSINYRWFDRRYERFLYVDRIVVDASERGRGIGRLLYEDLFRFARTQQVDLITCEFDVEPPNEASQRFHAAFGFVEAGSQWVAEGKKRVSLQRLTLRHH